MTVELVSNGWVELTMHRYICRFEDASGSTSVKQERKALTLWPEGSRLSLFIISSGTQNCPRQWLVCDSGTQMVVQK